MTCRSQENHPTVQRVLSSQRLSEKKGAAAHGQRVGAQDRRCSDEAFEDTQIAFSIQHYITAPTHGCWYHPGLQIVLQTEPPLPHHEQGESRHHVQSLNDVTFALTIMWSSVPVTK